MDASAETALAKSDFHQNCGMKQRCGFVPSATPSLTELKRCWTHGCGTCFRAEPVRQIANGTLGAGASVRRIRGVYTTAPS